MKPQAIDDIEDALRQCGVTEKTLAPREKDDLDRYGYLVLRDVMDPDLLARLRSAFETAAGQGRKADDRKSGTRHIADLAWKDAAFDRVYTDPRVLAAVYHVLHRPFKVLHLTGRDPQPGYGQQGLHTDWLARSPSEPFIVVTSLWLLDDFTQSNGATRLIPESHNLTRPLPKPMQQPEGRHPDQKIIVAGAGSALVFNGHLWHSGTRNESGGPRRVLQCQFVARGYSPPGDARADFPDRLTPAARYLLGA
jgi:ectoine hydroxylase-related dioxygenase (phytanoyl-CoA dioxygenase family)